MIYVCLERKNRDEATKRFRRSFQNQASSLLEMQRSVLFCGSSYGDRQVWRANVSINYNAIETSSEIQEKPTSSQSHLPSSWVVVTPHRRIHKASLDVLQHPAGECPDI